jgi:hypothetical protein
MAGSGSISQRHETADPDPHHTVIDLKYWRTSRVELIEWALITHKIKMDRAFYQIQLKCTLRINLRSQKCSSVSRQYRGTAKKYFPTVGSYSYPHAHPCHC